MSWVRNAVRKIEAQDYEKLHQTVFGEYGTKTSIFWAVDPNDVPVTLKENVEETVKDNTVGESKCAIIRLETLPAYKDEELQASGNPIACFSVYIGTSGSDAVYDRQINIYGWDRKPVSPSDGRPASQMWGEIEGNAISKRLRKMSVTMGWTEPPPMIRRESSAFGGAGSPMTPARAPVAERHMSLAIPDSQYRTEAASKRFTRKMSLRPGWMDSQSSPVDTHHETHDQVLAAALAALEGFRPTTSTSPMKVQEQHTVAGPSEITLQNMRKMSMAKRTSYYAQDPETNRLHFADVRTYCHENTSPTDGSSFFPQANGQLASQSSRHDEERPLPAVDIRQSEMTDVSSRRMKRMSTKRMSQYIEKDNPEMAEKPMTNFQGTPSQVDLSALSNALAALEGTATPREEHPLPGSATVTPRMLKRKSARRTSQFIETNIPESGEMPLINFQNLPSRPDPAALDDALAALEGAHSARQEIHIPELSEVTPRRMKRMSAKRVSLFLEDDIPEVGEPELVIPDPAPAVPVKSHRRKASVEYALAALEAPTPPQANMGRPRRPDAAMRSRKTMSMYVETSPGSVTSRAANYFPEPRSFFDVDPPETEFESTSRKLKRLSWNVIGRALPQPRQTDDVPFVTNLQEPWLASKAAEPTPKKAKRMTWLPTVRASAEPIASQRYGMASNFAWDQPASNVLAERHYEPVPRKNNRSSWYSMDPSVAEIQCSPRKEYGPPAPWLEPAVQPTSSVEPGAGTTRKSKRASWYPTTKEAQPESASPLREVLPAMSDAPEAAAEDAKSRKKMNRMSRFVFPQSPKSNFTPDVFSRLGGPLSSNPPSCNPSRPETPVKTPHLRLSRMKKLGVQLGRLFR